MDQSFKFTHQITSPFSPLTSFCMFILIVLARAVLANTDPFYLACSVPKTCGDGQIISYPFYIEGQQEPYCGFPGFQLSCNNGNPVLKLSNDSSYVIQQISYENQFLRVTNAAFSETKQDACNFPRIQNVSLPEDRFLLAPNQKEVVLLYNCHFSEEFLNYRVDNCSSESVTGTGLALLGDNPNLHSASKLCREVVAAPVDRYDDLGIEEMVRRGFLLKWIASNCSHCKESGGKCGFNVSTYHFNCYCRDRIHGNYCATSRSSKGTITKIVLATSGSGLVILIVLFFWISKTFSLNNSFVFWKKKTGNYQNIEAFLRNYGSIAPKRYTYSDIKTMTNLFKKKLGQGGYGGVYKGKLHDGRNVAVKVLNETKGNGEEFINEVASISRTSHVNIVTLLGFCFEGHRRALIYEFVSNGSLEKFIYEEHPLEIDHKLKWGMLYKIAIGIARGLEYLHRGCNTRILHFDIKPHNILLDEDFCPKISDFGLAKICPQKQSIVSMTGARGTIGYIAPEVFCRNFGQVSYKSDVYSYGMMVFEMTGGRKNINAGIEHSSEVYFPHWVYKRLELEKDFGLQGIENEEDKECAKKMLIVSLWCIQSNPSDRPAMNRVVEMLEGSMESLQMPPKPFLSSPGSPSGSSTLH